jgi:hypothetical protein
MTSLLACAVATLALGADADLKGLPFGIPPSPDDAVIAHVAPPKCLFYVNWAGTASPDPASKNETEKMLAEPEVQNLLSAITKGVDDFWRKAGEQSKKSESGTGPHWWDLGNSLNMLLTHPTAIFLEDVQIKVTPPGESKAEATKNFPGELWEPELRGGIVVNLGPEAAAMRARLNVYIKLAQAANPTIKISRVKIADRTWYRSRPGTPDNKNVLTFGFHGTYFIAAFGDGSLEGILARWNKPAPTWLDKAMSQTPVPRRTGIVYLNVNLLCKTVPWATSQIEQAIVYKYLGLDNVDSFISSTGLDKDGMVNRVLVAIDGEPHGLLNLLVGDSALAAKDLETIPRNALFAVAAKVDLERSLNALFAAYDRAVPTSGDDRKKLEAIKTKQSTALLHDLFSSLGDTCCVYNSPEEGEMPFLGWTAVVPLRNRAAFIDSLEKLTASNNSKADSESHTSLDDLVQYLSVLRPQFENKKCTFAGHDLYCLKVESITPAICISDNQLVATLSVPAMKAYLTHKKRRSLATQTSVKLALHDVSPPAALGYCDTPRLFNLLYPVFSHYSGMGAEVAENMGVNIDPTFWPSAPAIRPHLSPDVTTLKRTPHGLELTCRYCLPTGGINGPLWFVGFYNAAFAASMMSPFMPHETVPVEFDGLSGKKIAVICKGADKGSTEPIDEKTELALAEAITNDIKSHVKGITVVDLTKVAELANSSGTDALVNAGARLKADKVVAIDLQSFRIHEGQTLLRGHACLTVRVIDVATKETEWIKSPRTIEWPSHGPVPAQEISEPEFRDNFTKALAEHIARYFYPHDRHADEEVEVNSRAASPSAKPTPTESSSPAPITPAEFIGRPRPTVDPDRRAKELLPSNDLDKPSQVADPKSTDSCPLHEEVLELNKTPPRPQPSVGPAANTQKSATTSLPDKSVLTYEPATLTKKVAPSSQIYFVNPEGLTIKWDVTAPGKFDSEELVAPARYNFPQGALYRLKLTKIPGRPGVELFPTIEVAPTLPRTKAYLERNAIPVEFTDEDFDQVMTGHRVIKVIYLPDVDFPKPKFSPPGYVWTPGSLGTLVSTKLDPGVDPIVEADRKGAIMAIVRIARNAKDSADIHRAKANCSPQSATPPRSPEAKPTDEPTDQAAPTTNDAKKANRVATDDQIPVSPYFASKEDAFWNTLLAAIKPSEKEASNDAPSDDEVMRALNRARPTQDPAKVKTERNRVRIVTEVIQDAVDPPRIMPLVGPVTIHHVHFKCTVYFQETIQKAGQKPEIDEDCQEVIYIDHDHLHRADEAATVAERDSAAAKK